MKITQVRLGRISTPLRVPFKTALRTVVKDVTKLADTLRKAFHIAKSGRPGPVLVDVPKDVQNALYEYSAQAPAVKTPVAPAKEDEIEQAAEMILAAEKPYIYIGGGAITDNAGEEIIALADKMDAPIGCTMMGISAVPTDNPR